MGSLTILTQSFKCENIYNYGPLTFTGQFGHCLCVKMCNFIMYHTEVRICVALEQIATKNATKNAKCESLLLC